MSKIQLKPDVEAIFEFVGYRKDNVYEGYRPTHLICDNYFTTGLHSYYNLNDSSRKELNVMDKKQELMQRLHILVQEIDEAEKIVDDRKVAYLNNYKKGVENVIKKLQKGELPASKGGTIGTMRGISEYDMLSSIKTLYNAPAEVDLFYSQTCKEW